MPAGKSFDYVIIGAGSAGCTLAYRLSEERDVRVLLIEAGGWDRDPWIHIPLGWGKLLTDRLHDWMYFAEPEATMDGRRVECARGKVIGGSSSINAMAYVRGHRGDYERWAASGLPHWSYADVLPYFRRQESWEDGPDEFRGGDGPLATQRSRYADPLVEAFAAAGQEAGYKLTEDYNGAQQEGFCRWQMTVKNGRRCSAAVAYLRPALGRTNLTVETDALVSRILLEGTKAVGVEYVKAGQSVTVRAEREVILSGGVINSPQVMMLSGLGDPDALAALGIPAKVALRGVGKNLQDHISVVVAYSRTEPGTFHRNMRLDRLIPSLANAYFFGKGFAADLPAGMMAFLKSELATTLPDVQLIFASGPFLGAAPYLLPFKKPFPDGFGCRPILLRPESRGEVTLASADPNAPARIRQNFLATEKDWQTLRAGIRMAREIGRQPALKPYAAAEVAPGPGCTTDSDIDAFIRATAITVHHPLGTCRMGKATDEMAVVDPELKVRGVEGLRIVDASVMPDLVGGNINAPVIMIAEKAADLIRGRPLPAPVNV